MLPSREELLRKARDLPSSPFAVEAFWDGDTSGWYVVLIALLHAEDGGVSEHGIGVLSGGGDLRIFNNEVPPWPEARLASSVGREIAERLGVPFWFPSPDHPNDESVRFLERERGVPCSDCGTLLLQTDACPWKGTCYECHLVRDRRRQRGTTGEK